jgi:hypothetical protein
MNKKLALAIGLFAGLSSFVNAQTKNCPRPAAQAPVTVTALNQTTVQIDDQDHPYGGTFQIICDKHAGNKEVFTTEILQVIEANRKENEETILVMSSVTKIRILSKKQITAPGFQPIQKLYSFE